MFIAPGEAHMTAPNAAARPLAPAPAPNYAAFAARPLAPAPAPNYAAFAAPLALPQQPNLAAFAVPNLPVSQSAAPAAPAGSSHVLWIGTFQTERLSAEAVAAIQAKLVTELSKAAPVVSVEVIKMRGYAFATFHSVADAAAAKAMFDGPTMVLLGDARLQVKFSRSKATRDKTTHETAPNGDRRTRPLPDPCTKQTARGTSEGV